ncbi:hypothetical protein [Klebsiella variicola]|uniref:hypothetical protein n=1 Tax=Klebsiella variicola TaxID=244366 RepID=UPI0034DFC082
MKTISSSVVNMNALINTARECITTLQAGKKTMKAVLIHWNLCVKQASESEASLFVYDFPVEGWTRKAMIVSELERCIAQLQERIDTEEDAVKLEEVETCVMRSLPVVAIEEAESISVSVCASSHAGYVVHVATQKTNAAGLQVEGCSFAVGSYKLRITAEKVAAKVFEVVGGFRSLTTPTIEEVNSLYGREVNLLFCKSHFITEEIIMTTTNTTDFVDVPVNAVFQIQEGDSFSYYWKMNSGVMQRYIFGGEWLCDEAQVEDDEDCIILREGVNSVADFIAVCDEAFEARLNPAFVPFSELALNTVFKLADSENDVVLLKITEANEDNGDINAFNSDMDDYYIEPEQACVAITTHTGTMEQWLNTPASHWTGLIEDVHSSELAHVPANSPVQA